MLAAVWGVPPLTPDQSIQVQTAADHTPGFDQAALYPLLYNAMSWPQGDQSGAAVPDYEAIRAAPASYRSQVFLLEGLFAGRARPIRLSRPGPWEPGLQEWVLVTDAETDQVAVIYLARPPGPVEEAPAPGTRVRLAARFYKVLADIDAHGNQTDYLTFVGAGVSEIGGARADGPPTTTRPPSRGMGPLFALVIAMGACWYLVRRMLKRSSRPRRDKAARARGTTLGKTQSAAVDEPPVELPEDPAQALDVLFEKSKEAGD